MGHIGLYTNHIYRQILAQQDHFLVLISSAVVITSDHLVIIEIYVNMTRTWFQVITTEV